MVSAIEIHSPVRAHVHKNHNISKVIGQTFEETAVRVWIDANWGPLTSCAKA